MKHIPLLLAIIAAGAVLAFGAVEVRTTVVVECLVVAVALAEFWSEGLPAVSRSGMAVLVILVLVPLIQLVPMPGGMLQLLAPARASSLQQVLNPSSLGAIEATVSVQSYATVEGWLRLVCYFVVFLLALSWDQRSLPAVLPKLLVVLGVFEAVYGLGQYLTGFQYIFGYAKSYYKDEATGTYINRNHYAGLLEMVLPFLLAMILFPSREQTGHRRGWTAAFTDASFATLRQMVAFVVVFLALFFSRSRMGILSATVALALVAIAAVIRHGRRAWPALGLLVAVALVYALWMGVAPVTGRFEATDAGGSDSLRVEMWKDAVALIRDQPLLGTGLGTYFTASPRYQTHFFQYRIDHPHNDYLEWAAELGVPAALLLFGSLWWIAIRLATSIRHLERRTDLVLAVGCSGALFSLLLHSLTDFNTQIPANALLLAWISGSGAGLLGRIRENRI